MNWSREHIIGYLEKTYLKYISVQHPVEGSIYLFFLVSLVEFRAPGGVVVSTVDSQQERPRSSGAFLCGVCMLSLVSA